ncbi:hypothetical protein BSL78_02235 [Apostichopus japonicus]|uniref:Reverse transcriptase domain-containing protein n=1 Tax=Stichopus japonicus TaxID=307972 RepID=A0A2G8LKS1_STIJA|nr:hypothetical protein BSL78_02235 [Apostichopus japonicus]
MLREESAVFSQGENDMGCLDLEMEIRLKDQQPVQKNYNSIPRPLYREVKDYLSDLMARGWVRRSKSPYSSPAVCVRKKDGTLRLCIDYRALNAKTIPDRQPIPKINDVLSGLGGNHWFSTLDQGKAYHQGFVSEESRQATAFITPWGLYEWEHLRRLQAVLQRLKAKGVKLRASKCELFQSEVKYLGKIVSAQGYRADPEDTKAVLHLKEMRPKSVGEVRHMLGLVGYYRQFIRDFSKKARPLYDLLTVPPPEKTLNGKQIKEGVKAQQKARAT